MNRKGLHSKFPNSLLWMAALWCGLIMMSLPANAQQPTVSVSAPSASSTPLSTVASTNSATSESFNQPSVKLEDRYRIGPNDLLAVRFYNHPPLSSDSVRVSGNGTIRVPMIDEDISAMCLTEGELAGEISKRYLKYYKNPHIEVYVKEYTARSAFVIGQVNDPAKLQLQHRVRLLQALALAKGLNEKAGRSIKVAHDPEAFTCDQRSSGGAKSDISSYRLKDILSGDEAANPYIQPGDTVYVPEAEQIFVVGNVFRPTPILLKDDQITFSRAISVAGGILPTAKSDKIKLIRRVGESGKEERIVDLIAIQKNKAPDIVLQPDDIIDVGESGKKVFYKTLLQGIGGSVLQLPTRVVP